MNPIEQLKAWLTLRRRVRKVARARAEISAFADQIRRLGDHPGFLAEVSDQEAHHRLVFLLDRATDRVAAAAVALEVYGREGVEILQERIIRTASE